MEHSGAAKDLAIDVAAVRTLPVYNVNSPKIDSILHFIEFLNPLLKSFSWFSSVCHNHGSGRLYRCLMIMF